LRKNWQVPESCCCEGGKIGRGREEKRPFREARQGASWWQGERGKKKSLTWNCCEIPKQAFWGRGRPGRRAVLQTWLGAQPRVKRDEKGKTKCNLEIAQETSANIIAKFTGKTCGGSSIYSKYPLNTAVKRGKGTRGGGGRGRGMVGAISMRKGCQVVRHEKKKKL